nr:hypothetical protein [Tanacetum cinerariifolium]
MEDLMQQYLDELKRLSNLEYRDEIKIAELKENFNGMSIEIRKKEKLLQQEQWAYLSTHPSKRLTSFYYVDDDDDEDYTLADSMQNESVLFLSIQTLNVLMTMLKTEKTNDITRLQSLVDKNKVMITEATIKDALRLDDAEGVDCLPNEDIFAKLARLGYEKPSTKLTFYKAFFLS